MLKGKKVKLAFHAVVANYCENLAVNSIILDVAICLATGLMFT
jgi:predicted PolB exonuclease-like 3'-5' exonuclease